MSFKFLYFNSHLEKSGTFIVFTSLSLFPSSIPDSWLAMNRRDLWLHLTLLSIMETTPHVSCARKDFDTFIRPTMTYFVKAIRYLKLVVSGLVTRLVNISLRLILKILLSWNLSVGTTGRSQVSLSRICEFPSFRKQDPRTKKNRNFWLDALSFAPCSGCLTFSMVLTAALTTKNSIGLMHGLLFLI